MANKKSNKSAISKPNSSKPSSKSQSLSGKSHSMSKEAKTKQLKALAKTLAKMNGKTKSIETILIAPADYVPVFHREMKAPESTSAQSSAVTSTTCEQDDKKMVSKNTSAKTKKSAPQPKSQKGRALSQKTKKSSRQVKSAARTKSTKKSKMAELMEQHKVATYVVQALKGRMDNFRKQYDHHCNPKCSCLKSKERKSKKKPKVANE